MQGEDGYLQPRRGPTPGPCHRTSDLRSPASGTVRDAQLLNIRYLLQQQKLTQKINIHSTNMKTRVDDKGHNQDSAEGSKGQDDRTREDVQTRRQMGSSRWSSSIVAQHIHLC